MTNDELFCSNLPITQPVAESNTRTGIERSTTGSDQASHAMTLANGGEPMGRREVEKHLEASLPQSIVSSIKPVLSSDYDLLAYTIEGPDAVFGKWTQMANALQFVDDIKAAIETIEEFSQPASAREIGELITMVYAMTAQRNQDQITMDLAISSFGRKLLEYPADVVRETMTKWPDKSTWFPAWHDLKNELDWRNNRAKMRSALEKKLMDLNKCNIVRKF